MTSPAGGPDEQARLDEQPLARVLLEFSPEIPGAPQQRHVVGMLVIGEADEPRLPVRTAPRVAHGEAIDRQHAGPAAGEVGGRRRAHAPRADYDHVKASHTLASWGVKPVRPARASRHGPCLPTRPR